MSLLLKCKQLSLKLEKHRLIYTLGFSIYEILNDFISVFYRFFYIFSIKSNKIVFSNISGRGYGESPKYIAEELLKNKEGYDLVWLINSENMESSEIPSEIRMVKTGSFKALYELATARFWIDNTWKQPYVRKRRGQYFIQTWHGYGPKKIIKNPDDEPHLYIRALKRCSHMTDLFLIINEHSKEICHRDFWYEGEILESGYPRNDLFYSGTLSCVKEKVCNMLHIPMDKKIVLFAPTYRQDLNCESVDHINVSDVLNALERKFGGDWVFLLRLHPLMKGIISDNLNPNNSNIFDASSYMDMQELLYVSDFLITDYSSCMFDYMLMGKPCVLFVTDLEKYSDERGLILQLESMPIPISQNNKELINCISQYNIDTYRTNVSTFLNEKSYYDNGTASSKVVSWMRKKREKRQ